MQNVQKRNLQLCMQKVCQNDLIFSENPFFSRRFSREKCPTLTVASFFFRQTTISL